MDVTLLETEHDAVIVGTGMSEAILAGALARVGKKVLHLDQNDYYGSNYASFPLDQFLRWTRNEDIVPRVHEEEEGTIKSNLELPTLPIHSSVPLQSSFQCHLVEETFHATLPLETQQSLLDQSSHFSIDINPRLVLSSEEIVPMLITSGVGRYLEFAAIERTYIHVDTEAKTVPLEQSNSGTKSSNAGTILKDLIYEVPCSKRDVFASKLLGMVEKRMLMKFLQFVADYGETHILGEDVASKNERELALGRSLKRPQNKQNQVGDHMDPEIEKYLNAPFQQLLSQYFKLSDKLQQVVVYCVALASFPDGQEQVEPMSAREGLAAVYRYVASIGRFTGNAFLVPLYGVSEITQSFCRLCAVYGGIYVLRAPISSLLVTENKNKDKKTVLGIQCSDGRVLRAKHVIVNASYLPNFNTLSTRSRPSQVLRGVLLLSSSLRHSMNRFMIVIPPHDPVLQNPFVVHIIQLDHGAYVCPKNHFLVQATMVLPLSWSNDASKQLKLMHAIMTRLVQSARAEQQEEKEEKTRDESGLEWSDCIVWRAIFTMDHYHVQYSNATKQAPYVPPMKDLPSNIWICETSGKENGLNPLEVHLESACINAKAIFEQICPGEAFLPKSASAEQAEQEELEDEQEAVLKAAKKLAEKADQPKKEGGGILETSSTQVEKTTP